jgi:TonB-linked SusC/RagA family outer membrane protein
VYQILFIIIKFYFNLIMEKLKLIKCLKTMLILIGMSLFSGQLFAQNSITGKVVDETGQPLIGATVQLKGAQGASTTDINGKFSLTLPANVTTITVSYLGFYSQDVPVNQTSKNITVTLVANPSNLNEVVVVGYGAQKKRDVTGAITKVSAQTLQEAPTSNMVTELQGRVAGLDIVNNSSTPGASGAEQVRLRGNRTFYDTKATTSQVNALDQPFIVVDGIPFGGNFNDLDANNISNVEILKDASATAIYGSRGSGGVILVTTKKGKAGKVITTFNSYYGITNILSELKVYNGQQYAQLKADAAALNTQNPGQAVYPLTAAEQAGLNAGTSTDWQKLIYQQGATTDQSIAISGGGDATQYNVGAGYFNEKGIIPNQNYRRYSLRSAIDSKLASFLTVGFNSLNTLQYTDNPGGSSVTSGLLKFSPLVSPYNPDGSVNQLPLVGSIDATNVNPLTLKTDAGAILSEDRRFRTFNSIYAEASFLKYFKYRFNLGLDFSQDNYNNYTGANTYVNSNITTQANTTAQIQNSESYTYTLENLLTYEQTFAQKHHVTFTGLFSEQKDHYQFSGFNALGIPADYIQNTNFALASSISAQNGVFQERGLLSFMARANYSFDNRYVLTATVRKDGSSVLAPGHQYFTYPALGAAWNITNEKFMKGVETLDNLKLRVGWGRTGNQGSQPYQTLGLLGNTNNVNGSNLPIAYNFGQTAAGQQNGVVVNTLASPTLRWQSTAEWNIGVDFGLFRDRLTGTVDVYKENTKDILVNNVIPGSLGATNQISNLGQSRDEGLEISLSSVNIQSANGFRWSTDFVWAANREAITALPNGAQNNLANLWFVGQPISVIYDYKKLGIWQTGDPGLTAQTSPVEKPGQIKVQDVNGDGKINASDKQILGNFQPQWTAGLTNRFAYKGFDFSFILNARMGMKVLVPYISTDAASNGFGFFLQGRTNQVRVDYWTPSNPTNAFPRPDASVSGPIFGSTLQYVDGSFIKCRSINLGYTIPSKVLAKAGISSLRVFVSALNPFILYSPFVKAGYGPDPEGNGYGGQGVTVGPTNGGSSVITQQIVVNANNPSTRQFNIGVNLKF